MSSDPPSNAHIAPFFPMVAPSALLEATFGNAGSWTWEIATGELTWSKEMCRLFGLAPGESPATYESYLERIQAEDRTAVEQAIASVLGGAETSTCEHRVARPDGELLWLRSSAMVERDEHGNPVRLLGFSLDITADKRLERRLREQHDRLAVLATVVESTDDAVIVTSPDGTVVAWNPGAERLYGYTSEEAIGRHVSFIKSAEEAARLPATFAAVEAAGHIRKEIHNVRKDGTEVLTSVTISQARDDDGRPTALIGIGRDITEEKRAQELERERAGQLAQLAFRDPLTGLANRAWLDERLARALADRRRKAVSVLMLDLDGFKSVNDAYGHTAGDQLLVEVGRRLTASVRAEDTVARLGGDEFAILVEDGDAAAVAARLRAELTAAVEVEGREIVPHASIGVASSDGSIGAEELMLHADIAMYAAKANARGQVEHFSPAMAEAARERAELEEAMRHAVGRGEILVHHQPIIEARSESVCRMEALVRWQRPEGAVPPARFLAFAERSGLIVAIGAEVLRQACEQLHDWLAEDARRSFAINASSAQLAEPTFAEDVLRVLASSDVPPAQLVLEVTETLFLDPSPRLIEALAELRALGVRISVDDFGTGYSSLGRLEALPIDSIKIDTSFAGLIETGDEDLPILTSMILMAHALGLEVTAEGVETPEQAERLIALGCDHLQGYHFARPAPAQTALSLGARNALSKLGDVTGESLGNPVILVIEDDRASRALVRLSLNPTGFDVEEAHTGAEGLCLAEQLQPDCLLVDLGLPDMDGVEVVRELRSNPDLASTPLVVLTAAARRTVKAAAFAAGADDYIVKPIVPQHLPARLRGAMRGARRTSTGQAERSTVA